MSTSLKQTLGYFIHHEQSQLDEFKKSWLEHHSREPLHFPLDLTSEEWAEHYDLWKEQHGF